MMLPGAAARSPGGFQHWRMEGESRRHLKIQYSKEQRLCPTTCPTMEPRALQDGAEEGTTSPQLH